MRTYNNKSVAIEHIESHFFSGPCLYAGPPNIFHSAVQIQNLLYSVGSYDCKCTLHAFLPKFMVEHSFALRFIVFSRTVTMKHELAAHVFTSVVLHHQLRSNLEICHVRSY